MSSLDLSWDRVRIRRKMSTFGDFSWIKPESRLHGLVRLHENRFPGRAHRGWRQYVTTMRWDKSICGKFSGNSSRCDLFDLSASSEDELATELELRSRRLHFEILSLRCCQTQRRIHSSVTYAVQRAYKSPPIWSSSVIASKG